MTDFFDNETSDQQHSIDNMGDSLIEAMRVAIGQGRIEDAAAISDEWITPDCNDPCNGEYEFIFLKNSTFGDWTWDACAS